MRYFVQFSYLGSAYHGWQRQSNAITVQEQMESCFSTLLRTPVELVAAGRTDTGVHAKEMFAHFDVEELSDLSDLVNRLNSFLPDDISIQKIVQVPEEAHARFHATSRTYQYRIVQHKDPFRLHTAYYNRQNLHVELMNEAAQILLGRQDFEAFSKTNTDVKTFICDVKEANWQYEDDLLVFTITADRFLRNMVRAVVGTLLEVGLGKLTLKDVKSIIKSRDRGQAGVSVPAKGLYLVRVRYPKNILLVDG